MLPDFTFAYTEFDVSKDPGLVEPLLEKLLSSEVYLTLEKRDGEESTVVNANGNDLFISAGNSLGINYSTIDSEPSDIPIESITFINNQKYVEEYEQKFTFVDKVARIAIDKDYKYFNDKIV
jgi:hypothetical protein